MYDIRDLLNKAIALTEKRKGTYVKLLDNSPDPRLRILVQIMMSRLDQDIIFYKKTLEELGGGDLEMIDFAVYDMISSLINQFMRTITTPKVKSRKEFVAYVTEIEKSVYALMMDIQGRLAQSEGRTDSITYTTMSKAILHKRFRIQELENYKEV